VTISNGYITAQQFKDWQGIADVQDDNMIEIAINAACRSIDLYTKRRFYLDSGVTAQVYQTNDAYSVRVDDFSTVTGLLISTDESDNGTYNQSWTITTDFVVRPSGGIIDGRSGYPFTSIEAVGGRRFPTYGNRDRVQVTAKWGWAAVPGEVTLAALIKTSRLFRRKDSPEGVAGGFEFGAIRISKYEDPDVCQLLQSFVIQNAVVA
jgi:hypothetical protein